MKYDKKSFYEQITINKRLSIVLMIFSVSVIAGLGYLLGFIYEPSIASVTMILAVFIAVIFSIFSYYNSSSIVLSSVNAVEADTQKYKQIHDILEGVCIGAGMTKPKLYVINSPDINAFATGRDPEHSIIGVTQGAVDKLNKLELEGVLAHELSHIKNYDIRFMTLVSVLVGIAIIISEIMRRSVFYSRGGRSDRKGGSIYIIIFLIGIILAIMTPLIMRLIQFAVSRKREYLADASAVSITRYPDGLKDALIKIKAENQGRMRVSKATMHLFISNPLKMEAKSLFSTHPPIDERIKVLNKM